MAPFCGEVLSSATGPLDLVRPDRLALMVALYGCGALLCREVARRTGSGLVGLLLLGAAYGVWEEAFVDRYWFLPSFWDEAGIGAYGVVGHTNVLLAAHLTAFHAGVSMACSVLLVEWWAPRWRDRAWAGRPGLTLASVALASTPLLYGELDAPAPPLGLAVAAVALVGLMVAALLLGRARSTPPVRTTPEPGRGPRLGLALVAFGSVLGHWVVTYGVAMTAVPWPLGVVASLVPLGLGVLAVRTMARAGPYGSDGRAVVAGVLVFFALLDAFVGLVAARWDLLGSVVLTVAGVVWLGRGRGSHVPSTELPTPPPERTS